MLPVMIAALLAAVPAGSVANADTVIGRWRSPTKNGVIEIRRTGAGLTGNLVTSDDLRTNPDLRDAKNKDPARRSQPLRNLTMLTGFHRDGDAWVDGSVYNPADGRTYSGRITVVDGNTLTLRGCVFVPLCRTETWIRVR